MIYAFDFESALSEPGLQAPPPVCMSVATESEATIRSPEEGLDSLEEALLSGRYIIGCNTGYDLAVACAKRPDLFPLVFRALDEDRITCIQVRQKLADQANLAENTTIGTGQTLGKIDRQAHIDPSLT